jgi:hypothetical protein
MSDMTEGNGTLTPREVRLCREAVEKAVAALWPEIKHGCNTTGHTWNGSDELAARLYPMPTVEIPRVVREASGIEYMVQKRESGSPVAVMRYKHDTFWLSGFPPAMAITEERAKMWADLFANPTERVPADESSDASAHLPAVAGGGRG